MVFNILGHVAYRKDHVGSNKYPGHVNIIGTLDQEKEVFLVLGRDISDTNVLIYLGYLNLEVIKETIEQININQNNLENVKPFYFQDCKITFYDVETRKIINKRFTDNKFDYERDFVFLYSPDALVDLTFYKREHRSGFCETLLLRKDFYPDDPEMRLIYVKHLDNKELMVKCYRDCLLHLKSQNKTNQEIIDWCNYQLIVTRDESINTLEVGIEILLYIIINLKGDLDIWVSDRIKEKYNKLKR